MQKSKRKYHCIIYGASGYLAKFVYKRLSDINLSIALAARNPTKIDYPFSCDTIKCSIDKIDEITSKCDLLVNLAGPFSLTAEKIVLSCIKNNTNYIDSCCEGSTISLLISKYSKMAKEAEVSIVPACGLVSFPVDIFSLYLAKQYKESHIYVINNNFTQWYSFSFWKSLISDASFQPLPKYNRVFFYDNFTKQYYLDDQESYNTIVSLSTKYYKHFDYSSNTLFHLGGFYRSFMFYICYLLFHILAKIPFTRFLMCKYPTLFSFGIISNNKMTTDQIKQSFLLLKFLGRVVDSKGKNREIVMKVSGPEPMFLGSSLFLKHSLIQMIKNSDIIPKGIISPAIAFGHNNNIVDNLIKEEIDIEIIEKDK